MRALPLIERVLLVGFAVMLVALLVFLIMWHVRYAALERTIAAQVPQPGMVLAPEATPQDAAVLADFVAWGQRSREPRARAFAMAASTALRHGMDTDWLDGGAGPALPEVVEWSGKSRGTMRELDELLARGLHTVRHTRAGVAGVDDRAENQAWMEMSFAAAAWLVAARCDGDPVPAVAAQERLIAAMTPPDSWGEMWDLMQMVELRDRTCLAARLSGHAAPEMIARWHAAPDPLRLLMPCWERERCFWIPQSFREHFAMEPLAYWHACRHDERWGEWRSVFDQWWDLPNACAKSMQVEQARQADFLARRFVADSADYTLCEIDKHRLMLVADDCLAQRSATGALPAAPVLDLSGGPLRRALCYDILDAGRFTIRAEAAVVPPKHPVARWLFSPEPEVAPPTGRPVELDESGITVDCSVCVPGKGR